MVFSVNSFILVFFILTLLGFVAAAFFYRLIRRMPFDISLRLKETCPHCKKSVSLLFQVPFVANLFYGGKYPCCKDVFGKTSLLVSFFSLLISYLAFGIWFGFYGNSDFSVETFVPLIILEWFLLSWIPVFYIDFRYHLLPDTITIGGIVLGVSLSFVKGGISPIESIVGALVAGGGLFFFAKIIAKALGKEAMGFGDVKLLAGYGALMGLPLAVETLILSSVIGVCVIFPARLISKKSFQTNQDSVAGEFPFGPFLAIAAPIVFLFGEQVLSLYLAMFEV